MLSKTAGALSFGQNKQQKKNITDCWVQYILFVLTDSFWMKNQSLAISWGEVRGWEEGGGRRGVVSSDWCLTI